LESCFATMPLERCHRQHYDTHDTARVDICEYIDRFYNLTRRHSSLGNQSPIDFDRRMTVA